MPCGQAKSRWSANLFALPQRAPTHLWQPPRNTRTDSDLIDLEGTVLGCQDRSRGRTSNEWIAERIGNNFVHGAGQRVLFNLLFFRRGR